MGTKYITPQNIEEISALFGQMDQHIKKIRDVFGVTILNREGCISVSGEDDNVQKAHGAIEQMLLMLRKGDSFNEQDVRYIISSVEDGRAEELSAIYGDCICISTKGRPIKAKTIGQRKYIEAIEKNTVVMGIGPAGTGKTYLAVAMAVKAFKAKAVSRIILTRPAVEAGEKLGFLPGDLQDKVDPYLRPLYDALFDMMGAENFQKNLEKGAIEVAPLAYMRGRTLDESFIILDEAQNTTPEQMKMFLTRFGNGSRVVITGDITQIDLPDQKKSGLVEASKVLRDIDDIGQVIFTEKDVVRHRLVQDIIKAYETYYNEEKRKKQNENT